MHVQRINITLPISILKQLREDVPEGKRSKFIASALSSKLSKKKSAEEALEKSLKANAEFYKQEAEVWRVTETENWPE